jgi:hypothetical protein
MEMYTVSLQNDIDEMLMLFVLQTIFKLKPDRTNLYLQFAINYLANRALNFFWSKKDIKVARLCLAVYLLYISGKFKL